MKISKIVTFFSILACLVLVMPNANAQSKKKKKKSDKNDEYFDDAGTLKDKLWYGGGVGLGFGGSTFNFSISPMVGYKIYDRWSVGPRIPINYTYIKSDVVHAVIENGEFRYTGESSRKGFSVTSVGIGVFSRFKVIEQFFVHGEFSINRTKQVFGSGSTFVWDDEKDKIYTEVESTNSASLGIGYSSGDVIGYEISVLYDFLLQRIHKIYLSISGLDLITIFKLDLIPI